MSTINDMWGMSDEQKSPEGSFQAPFFQTPVFQPGRAARIDAILRQALAPAALSVADDSAQHAGHAGAQAGGETHFSVLCVSETFIGKNRVARSRAVQELLAGEFAAGLHALALTLRTPEEYAR